MPVYDAFISYSHAKDKPIAAALQSVIQKLGKPWYQRRALRVFRDDTSLSATPQLWPSIEQALAQSRYLLLLSSPEAAASPWVAKEVEYWLANKSTDTLFIGVTNGSLDWDGAANDFKWSAKPPLPEVLKGRFPVEPKWVDLTAYRQGADPRNSRFIEAGADFAAAIRGMPKEDLLSQEVRQQRRALSLAVSAAALLLLLAVGAVTAGIIARTQQLRAEKNFAAAKDTVDGLIFNITQGLRNVEGMRVETIDKILGQARATVEKLADTDPGNPELMRSRDVMLDEFAETYMAAGKLDAALKIAEEGLGTRREAAAQGMNAQLARDISMDLIRVGDIKAAQGDAAGALAAFEESLDLRRKVATLNDRNQQAQYEITTSLDRIGDARRQAGKAAESLKAYEESLGIRRTLVARDGTKAEWQRGLIVSLGKICELKASAGDGKGAIAACEESLVAARRLAHGDRDNTQSQRDIAVSLERIGRIKLGQGDVAGAFAAYQEGLAIRRHLAKIDAGNTLWQRDVLTGLAAIGDVKLKQLDLKGALPYFEDSLAVARKLVEADKTNSRWQRDLSIALDKIAYVKFGLGDMAAALAANDEGVAIASHLAETDPNNVLLQRDISVGLTKLGDVKSATRDFPGALGAYQDSLVITRRLLETDPNNVLWQRDAIAILNKLANLDVLRGDKAAALAAAEQSVAMARRLAAIDESNVEARAALAVSLYWLAYASDGEARETALDEALKIVERLDAEGKLTPDQKNWKDLLTALRAGPG